MPKPVKRFAKIYTEITNLCNLSCEFCRGTRRETGFVSCEDFAIYAKKIAPYTDYVYLHVMGEPLLHPDLGTLIDIAAGEGLKVSITTNGTLLCDRLALLEDKADKLYKISISLHSFEANDGAVDMEKYLSDCFFAAKELGRAGVIAVLRLWNLDGESLAAPRNAENGAILSRLKEFFPDRWRENRSGMKIGESVYLEYGERFDWPALDGSAPDYGAHGFCYAMKDHVAVLFDGRVVPCCLDADGEITLGDLRAESLDEILARDPAASIAEGFANHSLVHPLCRHCGFARKWAAEAPQPTRRLNAER